MSNSPFLNSIRTDMRQKGYALKTEKTYLHWIKRFILFHKKRHPQTMGSEEVRLFLSSLANSRHVAINTQKIALNALAFLYNRFLQQPLGDIDYIPASKPRRLPSVISANEVQRILQVMDTRNQVIFALLYGAGLRINECLRLRVKDFDFDNGCITVHDGKGGKSRNSLLPTRLIPAIKQLIEQARLIQQDDNYLDKHRGVCQGSCHCFFVLSSLLHLYLFFRVQRDRSNRLTVSDWACSPA